MPAFAFSTAGTIRFGRGEAARAIPEIRALGRICLVTGRTPARADWLTDALNDVFLITISDEPDVGMIETAVASARAFSAQAVVAVGGGAAIDAGKAIAALIPATRPMLDHLEVVGQGLPLDNAPLPFVAIPTTAGTGAEVTKNAVISVPSHRRKVSLRDARMLPDLAIVDPSLTDRCPHGVTLASGLDAITQVIEPYICTRANPLTDALCRDAIPMGLRALPQLMIGEDAQARDRMAWVSLCGGLALANAGLGVIHGLAGPLGGLSGASHGAICGALLPHGLAMNASRVENRASLERIDEIRGWIAGALGGDMANAFATLHRWACDAGLPGLDAQGISEQNRLDAAKAAASSSSMKANPASLTPQDMVDLMSAAR
ncbi:iron-containing alcohol dehydrogenase [Tropicibacter naphthalenivorans]|uniref:iron-containing alcohol dehydrogenase n=1 Tax=Tropicibacter naphthalenivorans TaxID=441103 RepID=UPI003521DBC6